MNDATRAKLDQLQELLAKRSEIEGQIEALFNGNAATPPPVGTGAGRKVNAQPFSDKPKATGPKKNKCGVCRKPGHQARTCDQNKPANYGFTSERSSVAKEKNSPLPDDHEETLAEAIREEWVDNERPALEVCQELAIQIGEFNRIVEKYKIVRK